MEYITDKIPHYEAVKRMINELKKKYNIISSCNIGKSLVGRNITAISIGTSNDDVLYVAGIHGSEWLTVLVLLRLIERICIAYEKEICLYNVNIYEALFGRKITFIPCANPDGVEIAINGPYSAYGYTGKVIGITQDYHHWQANARGIDINHNFDAGWQELKQMERAAGINSPSRSRYGGIKPESEPETRTLVNYCKNNNVRHLLALHSQGEVIYWDYGDNTPNKSKQMASIMSQCSGYALEQPEQMASHGGFKDWFIKTYNRPGFTIEIGKGENPLQMEQFDEIYNKIEEMLIISMLF